MQALSEILENHIEAGLPILLYRQANEGVNILAGGRLHSYHSIQPALQGRKDTFLYAPFTVSEACPILSYEPEIWAKREEFPISHASIFRGHGLTSSLKEIPIKTHNTDLQAETQEFIYLKNIQDVIQRICSGALQKAVISRLKLTKKLSTGILLGVFDELCSSYPFAFIHLAVLPPYGIWMGASPEVLLKGRRGRYSTMALAGTRAAGSTAAWGDKEIEEQAIVSRYIKEVLISEGIHDIQIVGPKTLLAGPIEHLCTHFNFTLTPHQSLGSLLHHLHPTPAVCGIPVDKAMEIIRTHEIHDRLYYTGFLGPYKAEEDIAVYVNLRCLKASPEQTILFTGGGITCHSHPKSEWKETQAKAQTLLAVIEKMRTLA